MRFVGALLIVVTFTMPVHAGGLLSEQQARIAAAKFVRGYGFGPNGGQVIPFPDSPAADKSLEEIAEHLYLALLVTRGDTGYCGIIREPTWVFIWNTEESASWFGGYPVMVNARTGKILDCRS
jgi:hypothetical protein